MHSIRDIIIREAKSYDLNPAVMLAIAQVESSFSTWAMRFEPGYRWMYDVVNKKPFRRASSIEVYSVTSPPDFPYRQNIGSRSTEWIGQKTSWGLFQVMGAVARECGYDMAFPALCDSVVGARYGIMHYHNLHNRFVSKGGEEAVIAAYNAGSPRKRMDGKWENQEYVERVLRQKAIFAKELAL